MRRNQLPVISRQFSVALRSEVHRQLMTDD